MPDITTPMTREEMRALLKEVGAFIFHIQDAPETAPDTLDAAIELERKVVDAINLRLRDHDEI